MTQEEATAMVNQVDEKLHKKLCLLYTKHTAEEIYTSKYILLCELVQWYDETRQIILASYTTVPPVKNASDATK